MDTCTECGHANESAKPTRGLWLWPFGKPKMVRCSFESIEQDSLNDITTTCNCPNEWHAVKGTVTTSEPLANAAN
jgi:hypothetical protein